MKTSQALKIMKITPKSKKGFMVSFEKKVRGRTYMSDHFPDKKSGEALISTEKEAWSLANKFAEATDDNYINIFVIDEYFSPVEGYYEKTLKRLKF